MGEYGFMTEGDDLLEQAAQIPSAVVKEGSNPIEKPWHHLTLGLTRLRSRLTEALKFVEETSHGNAQCRCLYSPDPTCVLCKAKRLIAQWEGEDTLPS